MVCVRIVSHSNILQNYEIKETKFTELNVRYAVS